MEKRFFGTDGIRGRVGVEPITPQCALKLGWAIGEIIAQDQQNTPTVLIARDTRLSGYMLETALVSGLLAAGVNTQCLGVLPTPALSYLTQLKNAKAGIMITASHNPYTDNGFKCFSQTGVKFNRETQISIENKLKEPFQITDTTVWGTSTQVDNAQDQYLAFCKSTTASDFSLRGKKIVVDMAHGATYQIMPQLLNILGAEVTLIGHEPNGLNINLACGSTQPKALQQRVLQEKAAIGIAFDGDGDRVLMVDHTGTLLDGDDLLFILAKHQHHVHSFKSQPVVGTVMSNQGLEHALSSLGIRFIRTPVGDQHIYDTLQKAEGILGGEPSGHMICKHLTPTADGMIAALQVLAALKGRSLYEARSELHKLPQYNTCVPAKDPHGILESLSIQRAMREAQKALKATQGRLLVRASGTEPIIRIMTEGTSLAMIQTVGEALAKKLSA